MKKYIFKIKVRGVWIWCHASHPAGALDILSKETGEPLVEYCLEWQRPKNLDGTEITDAEYHSIMGTI